MALTEKMKSFCREYFTNGGNATQAYLEVYDSNNEQVAANESSLLLKREDIKEYLATINKPLEIRAQNERQIKRQWLWDMINNPRTDDNNRLRAMDILNKMDSEYININRNIEDKSADIKNIDTNTLVRLSEAM